MAADTITVKIKIRWWVPVYVETLIFFCKLFRTEPDYNRVARVLERGVFVVRT